MARTVITYGTYDLFHVGHVRLLERARALGDRLVVGVSSDVFNAKKNKRSFIPFEQRLEIVASCRHVDQAFAEDDWEQKESDIRRYSASVFVMGDDWAGRFDHLKDLCEVVYLPRTNDISSSLLRDNLDPETRKALEKAILDSSR